MTKFHRFILTEILAPGLTVPASDATDLGLAAELEDLIKAGKVKRIGSRCGGITLVLIRLA